LGSFEITVESLQEIRESVMKQGLKGINLTVEQKAYIQDKME
jgi:hypothetical protein